MSNISYVSLSQATALKRTLDMTAHNLANANTAGYKAVHPLFESVDRSVMGQDVSFVQDRGVYLDLTGGALVPTGNTFDIALNGKGWFNFQMDNGETGYSRHGRLVVDVEGQLRTTQGHALMGAGGGPIILPEGSRADLGISTDGVITDPNGDILGVVAVSSIQEGLRMRPMGHGMYALPEDADAPQQSENPEVMQGFIEKSNVEAVLEMTRLIDIQRAYENSVKLMNQDDDLTKNAIQRLGRSR